ncbi:MAG: HD domain-containing protein [Clostridia bacterium]|nr:HD domain-containing protein [Clostridia bacterium]
MHQDQRLFQELERHLLQDKKPSGYFNEIIETDTFLNEHPFTIISRLKKVDQSPKHHPEGSVWNHTMLVLDHAAEVKGQSGDQRVFMWAALLHDTGKATTTRLRNGRITSYDHDKAGEKLAREFLECFTDDSAFVTKVSRLVRWHMQILFVTNKLPFANLDEMKRQVDIREIALLGLCDRLGRGMEQDVKKELDTMQNFINACTR